MDKTIKKREANLELLRIIAMLMVIALHYLGKGGALIVFGEEGYNYNSTIGWIFEALSFSATNIYVLISGYFLVNSSFKAEKIAKLWIQVFFYSVTIFLIGYLAHIGNPESYADIYGKAKFIFPVVTKHYWFASIYIVFYLVSPFLAMAVKSLSRAQLKTLIIVLCVFYTTLLATFVIFAYDWTDLGMGLGWFIILFLIAAYIRLYGKEQGSFIKNACIFIVSALCSFGFMILFTYVYKFTGKGSGNIELFFNYNSPTILIASVALFNAFRFVNIKEGVLSKIILFVSPLTFGIYLIHEHILLRELWIEVWKVPEQLSKPTFILHFIIVVIAVFVICGIIEFVRKTVFDLIYKLGFVKKIFDKVNCVNKYFN